jgi:probable F420-dependent oxidoreductase
VSPETYGSDVGRPRLGIVFPQTEIGSDAGIIRDFATKVEEAGYAYLAAYDHVLGHQPDDLRAWTNVGPYTDSHPFHEVFVLLAFLAAVTRRIELVTEVLILPQRQAALVAKQAAEIQLLSGGRLRLGIGVGWNPEEFRALGMSFHDRGKRIAEQVEVMRRLWTEDVVTFVGSDHSIKSSGIKPRSDAPIPIWMGGRAPVVLKRAAEVADGFILDENLERAPWVIAQLNAHLLANHRSLSSFGIAGQVQVDAMDLPGSARKAAEWKALGVTHLSVVTMDAGLSGPRDHAKLAVDFMDAWQRLGARQD